MAKKKIFKKCFSVLILLTLSGQIADADMSLEKAASHPGYPSSQPSFHATNRLIKEKSLYLLQHAHNPVDWFPWGKEALEKAKKENKPIFLSIGYASCHWCHVMMEESFSNHEIADILNKHFVSIKVDKDERPDIDHLYTSAVDVMAGSTGWPLTVILTPDQKPFYGDTYIPFENRRDKAGLKSLLLFIVDYWDAQKDEIILKSESLTQAIRKLSLLTDPSSPPLNEGTLKKAYQVLAENFDSRYGGFSPAPKFLQSYPLFFLLRYWKRTASPQALEMAEKTLLEMAGGGVHDQREGGFYRYAEDEQWRVPHYEKMLTDQALLAKIYLETYQATGKEVYATTAKEIFEYVLEQWQHPEGGFYSSVSLDVPENSKPAQQNKENPPKNSIKRTGPRLDDKILVHWNGLMISSLAFGSSVLNEPRYLQAAEKSAHFVMRYLIQDDRLLHRYQKGESAILGTIEDYSFFIQGLIDLYEAGFNPEYLIQAKRLSHEMLRLFWDTSEGGFFFTGKDAEQLLVRQKKIFDGILPSGNAVAAMDLLKLGRLLTEKEFEAKAQALFKALSHIISQKPHSYLGMLLALDYVLGPSHEIVVAGGREAGETGEMMDSIYQRFLPNKVMAYRPPTAQEAEKTIALIPFLKEQRPLDGKTTVYVCTNYVCKFPASSRERLREILGDVPAKKTSTPLRPVK